ncbi:type IIL restriction-modification enzyme MmeI [Deinococcus radiophilus]|uniref:type IIL restriction-modification enzyme MmeI n=1 Tax=Deinococcus radiophilus TaxID=32062 RepID=UPI00360EF17A
MAEHKSKGRDLDEATQQAIEYVEVLEEHERPQWVAVSDFGQVRLQEVATGEAHQFALEDLPREVERFAFLIGKQLRHQREADPVNVKAAQQMGKLHNLLEDSGYAGHHLELLLVRLLFLLFGDDTGLWDERGLFYDLLAEQTRSDGEDTGTVLGRLFQVLDTPREKRQANLPEHFAAFPYVNGELFRERIDLADFSPKMREMLLEACMLDWGAVSPAIFGSMFQAVMDETERRNLGAHYTSEANILKALRPLFLDDLHAELTAAGQNKVKLQSFLSKLPGIRVLDPACGSGNFLILAYRELRRLELEALSRLLTDRTVACKP